MSDSLKVNQGSCVLYRSEAIFASIWVGNYFKGQWSNITRSNITLSFSLF